MVDNNKRKNNEKVMLPKVDFAFKLLFGSEENVHLLKYLLRQVLKLEEDELEQIEIINPEQIKEHYEGKTSVLDVLAKLKNGKRVNIEIQIINTKSMKKRILFYWANMYKRQLNKNEDYAKLKKSISINILDFELFDTEELHSIYHIRNDKTSELFSDMLELHVIELPKLKKHIVSEESKEFIDLMKFLASNTKEELMDIAAKQAELSEIIDIMNSLSDDDDTWYSYLSHEKRLRDEISRYNSALEEGYEKGMEKGIESVAINLLNSGVGIELVSKSTGLSKEKLCLLKNKN